MGLWSGIKYALNSTLGTDKFMPLDRAVARSEWNVFDALYEKKSTSGGDIVVFNTEKVVRTSTPTNVGSFTTPNNMEKSASVIVSLRTAGSYYARIVIAPQGVTPSANEYNFQTNLYAYQNNEVVLTSLLGGVTYDIFIYNTNNNGYAYLNYVELKYDYFPDYDSYKLKNNSAIKRVVSGAMGCDNDGYGSYYIRDKTIDIGGDPNKLVIMHAVIYPTNATTQMGSDCYSYLSGTVLHLGGNITTNHPFNIAYQVVEFN